MKRADQIRKAISALHKDIVLICHSSADSVLSESDLDRFERLTDSNFLGRTDRLIVLAGTLLNKGDMLNAKLVFEHNLEKVSENEKLGVYAAWLGTLDQIYYDSEKPLHARLAAFEESVDVHMKSLEVSPNNCGIAFTLGKMYMHHYDDLEREINWIESAIGWLDKSIEWSLLNNDKEVGIEAKLLLAGCYFKIGNFEKSLQLYSGIEAEFIDSIAKQRIIDCKRVLEAEVN